MKAFKFFDLNNSGGVEPDEFAKAIEKIGIMIPTKQDLDALFNIYDKSHDGTIDYREFASEIFGRDIGGASPAKSSNNGPEALLDKLRKKLASRGARGIIGLSKQFRIMDDNHSMSLDKYEFTKAMQDYMLGFSEGEIQTLFNYMDYDHSGLIEYDEFLRNIRGPMNANRKKLVDQAFGIMDKDGNGYLDYNDIKDVYNAKFHPDVKAGKKTEQQVLQEFLETFETAHNLRNNSAPDHVVTKEEWEEYYNNVSASIDRDDYFAAMMNSAWNLDGKRVTKKGWSNNDTQGSKGGFRNKPQLRDGRQQQQQQNAPSTQAKDHTPPMNYSEAQLMDIFRKKLAARGARGIMGIGRQFRIADDDGSKSLNVEEFQKACHDFRIGITKEQAAKLFTVFDRDGSGSIDYDEFLRGVRGGMNQFRQDLVMKAFDIMDRDHSGVIDINDIRQRFNAKQHPDVKSGKKTEDEVLCEFLDTFEAHHADHAGSVKDHRVDKHEFIEYYNNISMSIERDDYFELMIRNAWHIPGGKGWAANTSIKRVLKTNADGSQEVVMVDNDLDPEVQKKYRGKGATAMEI